MVVKPGYKRTEVGIIPEDWDACTLDAISSKITDGDHLTPKRVPHGYYLLSARNVRDGRIDLSDVDFVGVDEYKRMRQRCAPQVGDLLLSCSGHGLGRVASVPEGLECVLVRSAALVKLNLNLSDSLFIQYWLQGTHAQDQISISKSLAAQPNLFLSSIEKLRCPVPATVGEQSAIGEALSDADALIESLERLITKKRQIKQGAMQELLTGEKRLPGFSAKWHVKELGTVADIDPENLASDTRPTFTFNYIALEDVDKGALRSYSERVFHTAPSRARRRLRKGDVLVSTVRPNLMSHLWFLFDCEDWVCSTGFCVVRCRQGITHPGYMYFHMMAGQVNRQIEALLTGSNYPAINSGDVRALQIPVPEFQEQRAIADALSDMDAQLGALEDKLAKSRQIKQGMMQELLTGRIRLV